MVSGYPDHVEIEGRGGVDDSFAVADPAEVLVWFWAKRPRVELTEAGSREWRVGASAR